MVDTEAWSQLDTESAGRLRVCVDDAGLGHLLTVLLVAPALQESHHDGGAERASEKRNLLNTGTKRRQ
jgi:hypothetical protein